MKVVTGFVFVLVFFLSLLAFYIEEDTTYTLTRLMWLFLVSIILFLILRRLFWSKRQTLFAILWYMSIPWVVQKSVVIENVHYFTILVLLQVYLYLKTRRRFILFFSFLVTLIIGRLIYPAFWIYRSLSFPTFEQLLLNVSKIFSFEFLFFRNSLVGAKNSIGIFYPETIPLFLIGLYMVFQEKRMRNLLLALLPWFTIILLTNEKIGGKEVLLLLPFFPVIFVLGLKILYQKMFFDTKSIILKALFISYLLFLAYGVVNFIHYFRVHYLPFEYE